MMRINDSIEIRSEVASLLSMAKSAVDTALTLIRNGTKAPDNADWCLKGTRDDYLASIDHIIEKAENAFKTNEEYLQMLVSKAQLNRQNKIARL